MGCMIEMLVAQFKQVKVQAPATGKTILLVSAVTVAFGGMVHGLIGGTSGDEKHPEDPACAAL